jgi:hypothetical protein
MAAPTGPPAGSLQRTAMRARVPTRRGFDGSAPLIRHGGVLSTTANPTDGL